MANIHRRFLEPRQIQDILRTHGIDSPPAEQAVLAGGTFNTVYRLRFTDRPGLVLKLTPDPAGPAMAYERGILRTEAEFYTLAGAGRTGPALPVPEVIAVHDLTLEQGGGQVLLVSELPGVPWSERELTAAQSGPLRARLGELVASLHQVTGPAFGYPSQSIGPLRARWADAFGAMIEAVLADAERYRAELPVAADQVRRALAAGRPDLDTVLVPTLVHFDLWNGNVLIDGVPTEVDSAQAGAEPVISGIIDGERSMWGDPVVDLVSTALFGEIRDDDDFIRGYRSTGAEFPLTGDSAGRRLLLYRMYLGLIMTVEPIPRGYDAGRPSDFARLVAGQLIADVTELERSTAAPAHRTAP